MRWKNYADFYQRSDYAAFPQEHRQSCGQLPFSMIHVEQGPHNFSDPCFSETVLALPLSANDDCTRRWTIDGRTYGDVARAGGMFVVPAEVESCWEIHGHRKILILAMPHETVRSVLGTVSPGRIRDAFWKMAEHAWTDQFVEMLMMRLWDAARVGGPLVGRMGDGIVVSILSHLLLRAGDSGRELVHVNLPRWRLNRVLEYVEKNLNRAIGLDEMSAAAGLSRRHFARSFTAELGVTPYKWLIQRRLKRAQDLLVSTDKRVSDVAEACGFSSQSHLTSVMRQELGATPHRWRQQNGR